jgi:hypothetical protein
MILVFQDDRTLSVASDEASVYRNCEGVDVQSGVYRFYNESGNSLKVVFDVPVKQGKWWSLWSVDSGLYHLEVDLNPTGEPLWASFQQTAFLEPNEHFASLDDLKTFLRAHGAVVDNLDAGTHAQ